LSNPNHLKCII